MLAPRKTLWSTPLSAVDHLMEWISLTENDTVCDIGCGDGRILLEWARRISTLPSVPTNLTFVGVDIDLERIHACDMALAKARDAHELHSQVHVQFVCANALQDHAVYANATIFFLYLIPRGLKLIHPLLLNHHRQPPLQRSNEGQQDDPTGGGSFDTPQPLQVVTYMAKLPGESVTDRALLQVEHQPGAAWPLYYYRL